MTYNEWRDELKSNLLCVTESERRRVLDYYAEAYADRRDAGFSEREIIDDFGAPYDAAQRILCDKNDDFEPVGEEPREMTRREMRRESRDRRREEHMRREEAARMDEQKRRDERMRREESRSYNAPPQGGYGQYGYAPPPPSAAPAAAAAKGENYTWVFVILCIVFAVPLFGLIMTMIGITIGFGAAPIAVIGAGATYMGSAIGTLVSGQVASGFYELGIGTIIFGVGVALCPIFFKLISIMWKLFKKVFTWIKNAFAGKEKF